MVVWNFDILLKNYGTIEKKIWYYPKNYGTIPKTMELRLDFWLPNDMKLWFIRGKNANIPKLLKSLNRYIALELWFSMKNYGTMEKLWKKLKYYSENNGTSMYYGKKLWYYNKL